MSVTMKLKRKSYNMKKRVFIAFWILWLLIVSFGIGAKVKPHVYPPECVGCGDCVRVCPKKGKAISVIRGKAVINLEECIACYKCVNICSYGAVRQ